ncbi:hypothetical protein, partial [Herbaspirillum autotrophicum]|uniref:hypothetical protein n=1 Tax=Herbaspirillum autotrophicum TaxID=180195 RepID=UPI000A8BC981
MKLDTDKERAMTPEFIEQQRPLFEAAFAEKYMKGLAFNFGGLDVDRNYFADWVQDRFDGWLLARSAGLSQEPVAYYRDYRHYLEWDCSAQEDNVGSMRREWCKSDIDGAVTQPDGDGWVPVFIAPPAPVSAGGSNSVELHQLSGNSGEVENIRDLLGEARGYLEGLELADRIDAALEDEVTAAPLSDAKDAL